MITKLYFKEEVQSIIFSKDKFSKSQAQEWLKSHDYKTGIDEKENTWRARQEEPSKFGRYATKEIKDGIKLVLGFK